MSQRRQAVDRFQQAGTFLHPCIGILAIGGEPLDLRPSSQQGSLTGSRAEHQVCIGHVAPKHGVAAGPQSIGHDTPGGLAQLLFGFDANHRTVTGHHMPSHTPAQSHV